MIPMAPGFGNPARTQITVIGIGNLQRGDDAVGIEVARPLKPLQAQSVRVVESSGELTELLEYFAEESCVIAIDAMRSGRTPGTIKVFNADTEQLPIQYFAAASTHSVGLAEAVRMSRSLGTLSARLFVVGIEARQFDFGSELSEQVRGAVDTAVLLVSDLIETCRETARA